MVKKYDKDFKETLVELYDNGQSVHSLSSEYGVAETTLYKWIDLFSKKGGQDYSRAEVLALKKQLARAKEENEILSRIALLSIPASH
jgi:transposase-like protein